MASRYWVWGTWNWDWTTTHWSDTSGGAGGFSTPWTSDDAIFDNLSNATAYTVTVTTTVAVINLTFGNPASGVLTFAWSSQVSATWNVSYASWVVASHSWTFNFNNTSWTKTLTTNSVLLQQNINFSWVWGTTQLADDLNWSRGNWSFTLTSWHIFDANGKNVVSPWTSGYSTTQNKGLLWMFIEYASTVIRL